VDSQENSGRTLSERRRGGNGPRRLVNDWSASKPRCGPSAITSWSSASPQCYNQRRGQRSGERCARGKRLEPCQCITGRRAGDQCERGGGGGNALAMRRPLLVLPLIRCCRSMPVVRRRALGSHIFAALARLAPRLARRAGNTRSGYPTCRGRITRGETVLHRTILPRLVSPCCHLTISRRCSLPEPQFRWPEGQVYGRTAQDLSPSQPFRQLAYAACFTAC